MKLLLLNYEMALGLRQSGARGPSWQSPEPAAMSPKWGLQEEQPSIVGHTRPGEILPH